MLQQSRTPRAIVGDIGLKRDICKCHRASIEVEDAAAAAEECAVVSDGTVLDSERAAIIDTTAVIVCTIVSDGTVLDDERAPVVDAAAGAKCTIAREGTVPDGERALIPDAAAEECLIVSDGAVLHSERARIPDAAAVASGALSRTRTMLDRHASERDRAAGDRQDRPAATAINDSAVLSRAANRDIAGDGDVFGIGPRRDINRGARRVVDRRLDGRIGVARHPAGPRPGLGAWEKGLAHG